MQTPSSVRLCWPSDLPSARDQPGFVNWEIVNLSLQIATSVGVLKRFSLANEHVLFDYFVLIVWRSLDIPIADLSASLRHNILAY